MPLRSARMPRQKASLPMPMQVIGPIPVMTARRCFPFRIVPVGDDVLRLEVRLHAAQRLARDVMDEEVRR